MEHVSSARPTGKFPEKVENLKRWSRFPGWNLRTECRVPFTFLVVCTSSRSTVGHRDVPGFKTKWNNFLPIGNSTFAPTEISGFFPKWKAPEVYIAWTRNIRAMRVREGSSFNGECRRLAWENSRHFDIWFTREMTSEERFQKFHTDDVSQCSSG